SAVTSPAPSGKKEVSPEVQAMEEQAMKQDWFYQFELPGGSITNCYMPEPARRIHTDRLAIIDSVLGETFGADFSKLSCLDIGCNQGYFAVEMARRGFRKVRGFDARRQNVDDAILMRRIYGLDNLRFQTADINGVSANEMGQFDVVLMLSVLFWLDNPIGALRRAKALTKKVLIIETPVAPDLSGEIDWGTRHAKKTLQGSFAVLDQTVESTLPTGSLTRLSLCPGRETLVWMMKKLGFSSVEILPVPPDAHEQLVSGSRIMFVCKV
ncbi:MAG: methyltransferase domain-containing protein, partial [Acidobacteriota bacterium]